MSLLGKDFQVIDTLAITGIIKNADGTTKTIFTGDTSKATLDAQAEAVEIFSGIGNNRIFRMFNKKTMSVDVNINQFDLDFIAYKNGVDLDIVSKGSFYIGKSTSITTLSATITNCNRIMSVRKLDGTDLKIVTGTPAAIDEVKVAIVTNTATLTFYTGYADASCLVTYQGDAATGKDNYTIKFYGGAFPKGMELLGNTVVYDQATQAIIGDLYLNLYSVVGDTNMSLAFEMGKPAEIGVKFEVLVPANLPDGTVNSSKEIGSLVITER